MPTIKLLYLADIIIECNIFHANNKNSTAFEFAILSRIKYKLSTLFLFLSRVGR